VSEADRQSPLPAGDFIQWRAQLRDALAGRTDANVACGTCTACCTSGQFVHIGPDETEALAAIGPELLFAAPGMPDGHVLMGYDDRGHCPMLGDNGCSIYDRRPRTCRTYDCRIFAAAGVTPDQPKVDQRVRRWTFTYDGEEAEHLQDALRAAAAFVQRHKAAMPDDVAPGNAAHVAVAAVAVAELFADGVTPPVDEVVTALQQRRVAQD